MKKPMIFQITSECKDFFLENGVGVIAMNSELLCPGDQFQRSLFIYHGPEESWHFWCEWEVIGHPADPFVHVRIQHLGQNYRHWQPDNCRMVNLYSDWSDPDVC